MLELKAPVDKKGNLVNGCDSINYRCVSSYVRFIYPSDGPVNITIKVFSNNKLVWHRHYIAIGGWEDIIIEGNVHIDICARIAPVTQEPMKAEIYRITDFKVVNTNPLTIKVTTDSKMHVTVFVDSKRYIYEVSGTKTITIPDVSAGKHRLCVFAGVVVYRNGKFLPVSV